jgi:TM2 domain-containing membrane protein YozV
MSVNYGLLSQDKNRKVAAVLAFAGILLPGLHKFYLGQPRWGIVYLLLSWTPVPKIASAVEGFWYLFQDADVFDHRFNALAADQPLPPSDLAPGPRRKVKAPPDQVGAVAEAVRQIEQLRQEGLMSEAEFEQKRRQLLDRIGK